MNAIKAEAPLPQTHLQLLLVARGQLDDAVKGGHALVGLAGVENLLVAVDAGLDGAADNEPAELVLQAANVGGKRLCHLIHVHRQEGAKVLWGGKRG